MSINKETNKDSFSFLVVSDIHENLENLRKIIQKAKEKSYKFDYILCAGDIVTVPSGANDDESNIKKYTKMVNDIINEMESVAPVLWVPGNHEPGNAFKKNGDFNGTNLHKEIYKLADDLVIIGLGGNPPILFGGKYTTSYVPFSTLNYDKFLYPGYPYNANPESFENSDIMYEKDLIEVINKAKSLYNNPQIILLTHCGPSVSLSTIQVEGNRILYMGSLSLGKAISELSKAFLDIHGHAHGGTGFADLFHGIRVLNPGAALEGNYAEIRIKREGNSNQNNIDNKEYKKNDSKWIIDETLGGRAI